MRAFAVTTTGADGEDDPRAVFFDGILLGPEADALLAGYVPGVGGAPGTVDPAVAQTIAVALAEAAAQVPRGAP
jgi:hypothetical protein